MRRSARAVFAAVIAFTCMGCRHHTNAGPPPPKAARHAKVTPPGSGENQVPEGTLSVLFMSVAPGNCILVTTPSGKHVLIDAAPAGSEQDVLERVQAAFVTKLDYVVVTDPTPDHIGCLNTVLSGMPFSELITSGNTSSLLKPIVQSAKAAGAKTLTVHAGSLVPLDEKVEMQVLAPSQTSTPANAGKDWYDNHSLVFRIVFGKGSVLFTGDMGPAERQWIADSDASLRSSVVTGMRHGDRSVCNLDFLSAVSPVVAVLMCATHNHEGHPHRESLEALNSDMAHVFRTDIERSVKLDMLGDGRMKAESESPASPRDLTLPGSESKDKDTHTAPVLMNNSIQ